MQQLLYSSIGTLRYGPGFKLIVEVDQGISDFYRCLIPKWNRINRPRYDAHVTVVRQEKETPVNLDFWSKYQDQPVEFLYSPEIQQGKIYYWLNIFCVKLEDIRLELGLPVASQYTSPPEGFKKCFHCTIGNCKL